MTGLERMFVFDGFDQRNHLVRAGLDGTLKVFWATKKCTLTSGNSDATCLLPDNAIRVILIGHDFFAIRIPRSSNGEGRKTLGDGNEQDRVGEFFPRANSVQRDLFDFLE